MRGVLLFLTTCILVLPSAASGQRAPISNLNLERARAHYTAAWEHMQSEKFDRAAAEFQLATDFDPKFAMAWYGLGRAHMALKLYRQAVQNLVVCRDLFSAETSRQYNAQADANRARQDRLLELQDMRSSYLKGPATNQSRDMVRLIENQIRMTTDAFNRDVTVSIEEHVPAFVSLALGSAYFRTEQFDKAERAYKDAIRADDSVGAAHNNLAVLYLMRERVDAADSELKAAEKAGLFVDPDLKEAVRVKRATK